MKTGIAAGRVRVTVDVRSDAPASVNDSGEEIFEVSLDTTPPSRQLSPQEAVLLGFRNPEVLAGHLRIMTLMGSPSDPFPMLNPEGGPCRLRVHARGRAVNYDGVDEDPREEYLLATWPAPISDAVIHKQIIAF